MMEAETQRLLRTSFHEVLTRMPQDDFTPVKRLEDIVNDADFESRHWMREVFGEAHDPECRRFRGSALILHLAWRRTGNRYAAS
jgi:hypothetical protein